MKEKRLQKSQFLCVILFFLEVLAIVLILALMENPFRKMMIALVIIFFSGVMALTRMKMNKDKKE